MARSPAPPVSFCVPNPEKKQDSADANQADTLNDLAENTLLALVRTGIGNDFEEVVFPQYPSLRITKRQLMGSDSGAAEQPCDLRSALGFRLCLVWTFPVPGGRSGSSTARPVRWGQGIHNRDLAPRPVLGENVRRVTSPVTTINRRCTGRSTNGRSRDFESLCLGSNPSRPTKSRRHASSHLGFFGGNNLPQKSN